MYSTAEMSSTPWIGVVIVVIIVWSDNTGSGATSKRGTAKSWDHACMVHGMWLEAAQVDGPLVDRPGAHRR